MEFVKKANYTTGDVVYAQNLNMNYDYRLPESESNSRVVKNFFVILYAESQDPLTIHRKNYLAVKLTTNIVDEQIYTCGFDLSKNNFLNKQSWVSCSKVHTLDENQIIGSLGTFDKMTMKKVTRVFTRFQNEVQRQLLESI